MAGGKEIYSFKFAEKDIETTVHTDNSSHITQISVQVGGDAKAEEIQLVDLKVARDQDRHSVLSPEDRKLLEARAERAEERVVALERECKNLALESKSKDEQIRALKESAERAEERVVALERECKNLALESKSKDEQIRALKESAANAYKVKEIMEPNQCRLVKMPDNTDNTSTKVVRLLYTNSGVGVLALGANGVQKLWKWEMNEQNPTGKATASIVPPHWKPSSGRVMNNDVSGVNLEEAVPCIALSKNDSYVISACGGRISLFNLFTFKVMTTCKLHPPASTFLAFHPRDNNVIAIGMEDSTIHIYHVRMEQVKSKLKGHDKRITGLAFSENLNLLVSSGADAQIFVWSINTWERRNSIRVPMPSGKSPDGDTRIQFHADQIRLLVVHETQLAIYDVANMDLIRQWVPHDALPAPISNAAYACNSQLIYATFVDGNIGVFDADNLRLKCRVAPSAYLSPSALNGSQSVYPLVVATHPEEPNQFAVGLTDGSVKVMEPTESEAEWGLSPPVDNGLLGGKATSSSTTSNLASGSRTEGDVSSG